jgi:hypothetical protein
VKPVFGRGLLYPELLGIVIGAVVLIRQWLEVRRGGVQARGAGGSDGPS